MVALRKRAVRARLSSNFSGNRNKALLLVALVLLAIAAWLANNTQSVATKSFFVAAHDLPTASKLDSSTVSSVEMQLSDSNEKYLSGDADKLGKWFLTRPLVAGELIPLSGIASVRESKCTPIILSLDTMLPSAIQAGADLDIWAAEQSNAFAAIPYQVAVGAELIGIKAGNDGIGVSNESIEVCVSVAEVRSVVEAIAKNSTVVAVRSLK